MLNPVAVAIPVFFALIGVEYAYARAYRLKLYRLNDALTDLGCGVVDQVGSVFFEALLLGTYIFVWHASVDGGWLDLLPYPLRALYWPTLWQFAFANVAVDLGYYLWHRASHRVNFIWATHVVHHQSDEYNLAVALRQAVFAGLTSWPFYLWIAALGVPPEIYAAAKAFNLLYQFWIHTRVVGKLGPIEWIFNTPSHHRVHHGVNARYIDKNYAGVLIIWDKLFGTFEPETETVVYGTVTPFRSWNPLWAQLEPWTKLFARARKDPALAPKLFFGPPETTLPGEPPVVMPTAADLAARTPYDTDAPRWHVYAMLQWIPIAIAVTGMLLFAHEAPKSALAAVGAWVLVSLGALAGLFEDRPWAFRLEVARQFALIGLVGGVAWALHPAVLAGLAWPLLSLPWAATTATNPPSSAASAA